MASDNEYGVSKSQDKRLRAMGKPEPARARRATMKPLVTSEVRKKALADFDAYFAENYPGPRTIIGDPHWHAPKIFRAAEIAIEAALEPLLAEREAVIVEECARACRQPRQFTGEECVNTKARWKDCEDAIRKLSALDALARHDAAVRLEGAAEFRKKFFFQMGMEREQRIYSWHDVEDALGTVLSSMRAAALEGKP